MTNVLFVDDHPIVLQGCRTLLEGLGVDQMHTATSVAAGFQAYLRYKPAATIVDLAFEGDDLAGLALIKQIVDLETHPRVLVFTMHNNPAIVSRALENGALAYVLKDVPSAEFSTAFTKVLMGEAYLSYRLATQVAMLRSRRVDSATSGLTARERQILGQLARGASYDQIADTLGISYKTVTNASSAIRAKLKIGSLAGLIHFAIQNHSG